MNLAIFFLHISKTEFFLASLLWNVWSKPKYTKVQGYVGTEVFQIQKFIDLICYVVTLVPIGYDYSPRRTENVKTLFFPLCSLYRAFQACLMYQTFVVIVKDVFLILWITVFMNAFTLIDQEQGSCKKSFPLVQIYMYLYMQDKHSQTNLFPGVECPEVL